MKINTKILLLSLGTLIAGMHYTMAQEVMKVYPGKIPGAVAVAPANKTSEPTLSLYTPEPSKANGTAVIICPGGGYSHLAMAHEGDEVAKRFAATGVTAFVLKYRLPNDSTMQDKSFGPLQDAQQAIYLVRKNAAQWKVNPDRIGIMGFSAGGHLASSLTVHYNDVKIDNKEQLSLRPDFAVLIYPVISFIEATHVGSMERLIGKNGTRAQKEYFSNERHVNARTPVTFLVHANDDRAVPVANSLLFNQAMLNSKVPVEAHLYQGGGHGFGLHNKTTREDWFESLLQWMTANALLKNSNP